MINSVPIIRTEDVERRIGEKLDDGSRVTFQDGETRI